MVTDSDIEELFGSLGPLATRVPGYRARAQQVELARAVLQAIEQRSVLVAEAGTGTGKTFAYLVPALLAGGKVIVSTGTKPLQDQLYFRDIRVVREALKIPVHVALLKGRANYVCHYHLEQTRQDGRLPSREDAAYLTKIVAFAKTSSSGDKAQLATVPENASIWPLVTSTRDNCLGQECPSYQDCFVLKARRDAMQADVVVVNHHLFFADVLLRDEGAGELLPACNTVIFDEAHQLPDIASLFFGDTVTSGQVLELARDTKLEAITGAGDYLALPEACAAVDKAMRDLRLVFKDENNRLPAAQAPAEFLPTLATLLEKVTALREHLTGQGERSEGLGKCRARAQELAVQLAEWQAPDSTEHVRWLEIYSSSLHLNRTPLDIAKLFGPQVSTQTKGWIFTSATLSVNKTFDHYTRELGLFEARCESWDSPFDYPRQALLYVPQRLPDPNSRDYTRAVVMAALPLLEASHGRAFLLFTSLRAMREAHSLLQILFKEKGWDYPLLLQGEGSRSELLDRFRTLSGAVLVASQTFWEGIDVKGETLSLVVIDRLPFAPPDDPVLAARVDQLQKAGGNPFMSLQLPRAAITLKQGAGRLIRSESDFGVLMIADPRLVDKPYGKVLWQSLPRMTRTRKLEVVQRFFRLVDEGKMASTPVAAEPLVESGHAPE